MYYEENEARRLVIEAGHKLLETKLTARTWGNISARISNDEFVITPSGRAYENLKPEELVKVKIADCSYEGDIKPSSEKGIHAAAYALRPEISFVIHTHQHYASAVCAEGKDVPFAPCAAYGLPGTKTLRDKMALCIAIHKEYDAFLMAKHGALCLGKSYEEAFDNAYKLEEQCRQLFAENSQKCKNPAKYKLAWIDDYAQLVGAGIVKSGDDAEAVEMITAKNRAAAEYVKDAKPLNVLDAGLQRAVYVLKYSKLKNKK